MFASSKPPKIKTKTVSVPVRRPPPANSSSSTPRSHSATTSRPSHARPTAPAGPRFQLSSSSSSPASHTSSAKPSAQPRQSLSVSRVQKRKVTPTTPQWASSDESSEDENDRLGAKRPKRSLKSASIEPSSLNRALEPDPARRIRRHADGKNNTNSHDDTAVAATTAAPDARGTLTHGRHLTRGEFAKNYRPAWPTPDATPIIELQYPSTLPPEKFEAKVPLDENEYNPLGDVHYCIEEIIAHYLPPDLAAELSSDVTGTVRLLKRAAEKGSLDDYQATLGAFNALIKDRVCDGTIARIMDDMHAIPLSLVKRLTLQSYSRIVSPYAHRLRKVKGKETTYGELLPVFVHRIFAQTGLNSSHVFVDLGSGVGNVVLQSALQTGAESWGIEIMPLAASLATKQAAELRARARLWNISLGAMTLLHGDFLDHRAIDGALARADVVLVNNKVFGEDLNNSLLQKFLDLKTGCRVVSLESFGGGAAKQGVRNEQSIAGLFDEERFESGTECVSWAGESVEWFVATKVR